MNKKDWYQENVSGYDGYRNRNTGDWIYASMYNARLKNMSKFDTVTEVHTVMFEDASGTKHDTKAKAEAANKKLKFSHYFDQNVCMEDLDSYSKCKDLVEFLETHKDAILELLWENHLKKA